MDSGRIGAVIPGLQFLAREVSMGKERMGSGFNWRKWWRASGLDAREIFGYDRRERMPSVENLVGPHFHPRLPLVGLNYTKEAQFSLHRFENGWTDAIRVCRGIIFDKEGNLIALPFQKFFNLNEHMATKLDNLPFDEEFEVIEKIDGHLGIIFMYDSGIHLATRGSFVSESAQIGKEMLIKALNNRPYDNLTFFDRFTACVEIIHPKTFVQVKYDEPQLVLVGVCRIENSDYKDYSFRDAFDIASVFGFSIPRLWARGRRRELFDQLLEHARDLSMENQEGFVVRFENGLRVKVKFLKYIQELKARKFNIAVLMRAYIAGGLEQAVNILPEEKRGEAQEIWKNIERAASSSEKFDEQKKNLYALPRGDLSENYFQQTCRRFLAAWSKHNKRR